MAGYLSETDFVMVEEGFSTRDLLEELTLGASQATTVRVWEWGGWALCSPSRPSCPLGPSSSFTYLVFSPWYLREAHFISKFLVLAPKPAPPVSPAFINHTTITCPAL